MWYNIHIPISHTISMASNTSSVMVTRQSPKLFIEVRILGSMPEKF